MRPNIMTRISLTVAFAMFGMCVLALHPARAGNAPWCAIQPLGPDGGVTEDCSSWSLDQCVPEVIAGNRGWCGQNPRWQGPWPPGQRRAQRRSHRY
jgi:hypothetical protein